MLNRILNEAAGTQGLDATGAAALIANTPGAALVGALNTINGTRGLGLDAVANALAGTTGLSAVAALQVWASGAAGTDGGDPLSTLLGLLDGGAPASAGGGVSTVGSSYQDDGRVSTEAVLTGF